MAWRRACSAVVPIFLADFSVGFTETIQQRGRITIMHMEEDSDKSISRNSIWPASFQPSHRMPERYLSQHFVQHCIGVFPQAPLGLCCVGPSLPIILYVAAPLGGFDGEFGRISNSLNSVDTKFLRPSVAHIGMIYTCFNLAFGQSVGIIASPSINSRRAVGILQAPRISLAPVSFFWGEARSASKALQE